MNYNYHTHTARCGHASGTEEEYIQRAIAGGIRRMGFSEHIPFRFPDGYQSGFRVPMEQLNDYFATLRTLQEKYRDQIELKIGFEMEYYPLHFETMLANARIWGADYLILGQHFIGNERPNGFYSGKVSNDPEQLKEYVDCVVAGIRSGVFSHVAHPDVFHFIGSAEDYAREMRRICIASCEYNMPLEINFLGIRDNRPYPRNDFWVMAGEEGCPVTFGFDSHDAPNAYDSVSLIRAQELVKTHGLNYIGEPKLIAI